MRAPCASATAPAAAKPSATPTPSPLLSQLNPSVRAATGTSWSTRPYAAISVGLMATPASSAAGAIAGTPGASSSGTSPSARNPVDPR